MGSLLIDQNNMFKAYRSGVVHCELSNTELQPKFKQDLIDSMAASPVPKWIDEEPMLVLYDGWIYKPGQVWYRFRPDGRSPQRLEMPSNPENFQCERAYNTRQFGLVGFDHKSQSLYKITPP